MTVDGDTKKLDLPFLVIATQNPVESQGTFPLPEAQLDRFLMMLKMDYPTHDESIEILKRFATEDPLDKLTPVTTKEELSSMQEQSKKVFVSDILYDYAKALAFVRGRDHCIPDDFKELAVPVLAHRLTIRLQRAVSKEAKFLSKRDMAEEIIGRILDDVTCPTEDFTR